LWAINLYSVLANILVCSATLLMKFEVFLAVVG